LRRPTDLVYDRCMDMTHSPAGKTLCGIGSPCCVVSAAALLATCLCWHFANLRAQQLLLGVLVSVTIGLLVRMLTKQCLQVQSPHRSWVSAALLDAPAEDCRLVDVSRDISKGLENLAEQPDPILQELAGLRLAAIADDIRRMGEGKIALDGTESWRTAYERVLRTPGLTRYFSVAWLRNEDYWRDSPGKHGMRLNYDLVQLGLRIERTLILADFFWPTGALLPAKSVCRWIEQQHKQGIIVRLVRESEIADEQELLCDFGIYGNRAMGLLQLDEQCRTTRFTLDFDMRSVQLAEERWRRLLLFAISFRDLLDQKARGG